MLVNEIYKYQGLWPENSLAKNFASSRPDKARFLQPMVI